MEKKYNFTPSIFIPMKHLLVLLFMAGTMHSQTDSLNHRNADGKKNGWWKVYLDDKTNPTDSVNASFYALELYDNGKNVSGFHKKGYKKRKRLEYYGPTATKGNPIPIKGVFSWYDGSDELISQEVYDKGSPVTLRSYAYPNKSLKYYLNHDVHTVVFEDLDYTKTYNNTPGTFYYQEHSLSELNKSKKFWYRNGDKGWKCYKIEE